MKRYLILLSAVVMQMCLGATYSWSVYVKPIKGITGLLQGSVQLPFSVFYFVFPLTMFFTGTLLTRVGPRICAAAGGLLFGSGWLLASLGGKSFFFTVAGIGILGGVGAGLAYIVPIATCIQWFPDRKGLVTGIAVAGFGGGAALVSQIGGALMATGGLSPFAVFALLGGAFLVLVTGFGFFMENNPALTRKHTEPLSLSSVTADPRFRILYIAMFTGLTAGFAVNANIKELTAGVDVEAGIAAVSLFAVANALGRVAWGMIFDRSPASFAVKTNLLCQALLLLVSCWVLRGKTGLYLFSFIAGFNYGGVLVLYVSSAAGIWGSERVGQVYAWLFSANIPAAVSPIAAGYGYDLTGSFTLPLAVIGVLMVLSALLVGKNHRLLNRHAE